MAAARLTLRPKESWRNGITQHVAIVKTRGGIELWKYLHGENHQNGVPTGIRNNRDTIATVHGMMSTEVEALNDELLAGSVKDLKDIGRICEGFVARTKKLKRLE